jgi:ferredoxin-type protein NapG
MTHDPQFSRRNLFRGNFGETSASSASRSAPAPKQPARTAARYQKAFPVLRSPGAVEEEAFLAGCTLCQACIEVCPHDAIRPAPLRFRRAAQTPMIDPIQQPCWMCDDVPCIKACEPQVLRLDLPMKMGTARIDPILCLPHQGRPCAACVEACPVPGAIELVGDKPKIVDAICTGCGVCQFVCPAPDNAVLLVPLPDRPQPPPRDEVHVDAR